ncbi:MAG: LysR family transcriptional regulator [Gammaproteobacteria bacterium]|nr:LysR family transcriptional regulator [Gammaproteobacteria bacterium]
MARPDLNLFRVFDAIYTQGNLTRAGELLHVSQPAVSSALARLRRLYGDPLFVRGAEGMTPTPFAEAVAPDVRRALQLLQSSVAHRERFDPAASDRSFRIATGDLGEVLVAPALIRDCATMAPGVTLEVVRASRAEIPRALAAGQVDFAIDALPVADAEISTLRLLETDHVVAVRAGHALADPPLTLDRYLACAHVHASSRRRGAGPADIALRRLGRQRQIVLRTQHHLQAVLTALHTDLVLTAPAALARLFALHLQPVPFAIPRFDLFLFWHRGNDGDPACAWLRERIAAGSAALVPPPAPARPQR